MPLSRRTPSCCCFAAPNAQAASSEAVEENPDVVLLDPQTLETNAPLPPTLAPDTAAGEEAVMLEALMMQQLAANKLVSELRQQEAAQQAQQYAKLEHEGYVARLYLVELANKALWEWDVRAARDFLRTYRDDAVVKTEFKTEEELEAEGKLPAGRRASVVVQRRRASVRPGAAGLQQVHDTNQRKELLKDKLQCSVSLEGL